MWLYTHTHTHTGSFRKRKNEKGITLIALVITIIVLIILAGISIMMISGQDGILNRASSASVQSDIAGTKEQIQLELIGKYDTNGEYTNADVITAVKNATGKDVVEKAKTVLSKKGNEVDISDLWVTASTPGGETGGGDTTITDRTGIQVGDYVDYTPDSASAYSSSKLAESITGSSDNSSDLTQDTLTWQVLRIYDNGAMDLIGSPTSKDVYFYGSLGYNNGVYVMNDICESLYSKKSKGITARSVNLEDMEKWLTPDGIATRGSYSNGYATYGEPKTYTGSYSYRPDIFGKTENESDKYYTEPTTNTYSGGDSSDTLEVKQTYYDISIDSTNYGDEGKKVLSNSTTYWVASRYVICRSDYAGFGLHLASDSIGGSSIFYSYYYTNSSNNLRLRPVVSLGSNIQITPSSGENSPTNMHTINWN